MFNESIIAVTAANFDQEVLQSELPVIVDFWAPWCGPCKMAAPRIEQFAKTFEGRVKVVAVDADANKDWVKSLDIRTVPTLRVYKGGEKVGEVNGPTVMPAMAKMFDSAAGL